MNQREAKRIACRLVADLLATDIRQDSWLAARTEDLAIMNRDKVIACVMDLISELEKRGGVKS